jgi:hypothetical protein
MRLLNGDQHFADLFPLLQKARASAMSSNGKIRAMAGFSLPSFSPEPLIAW